MPFSTANLKKFGNNKKDDFWGKVDNEKDKEPKVEVVKNINIFEQPKVETREKEREQKVSSDTKQIKKEEAKEDLDFFTDTNTGGSGFTPVLNTQAFEFDKHLEEEQTVRSRGNSMEQQPQQKGGNDMDFMLESVLGGGNKNNNINNSYMNNNNMNMNTNNTNLNNFNNFNNLNNNNLKNFNNFNNFNNLSNMTSNMNNNMNNMNNNFNNNFNNLNTNTNNFNNNFNNNMNSNSFNNQVN